MCRHDSMNAASGAKLRWRKAGGAFCFANAQVARAHPHLEGLTKLRFENPPHAEAARGVDAVIMGLPHGASCEVVDAVGEWGDVPDRDGPLVDVAVDGLARQADLQRPVQQWLQTQ